MKWIQQSVVLFRARLRQSLYVAVFALGTLLPMMHQSSLGTLLVVMGPQVNPLWQTPVVPLLFLLSAITIGYGVVLFESCVASSAYRMEIEMHLLQPLAFSLIIGGAIGNVIDRFVFGAVVDFLYFHIGRYGWPAFNVADSAICVGVALMILAQLREHRHLQAQEKLS